MKIKTATILFLAIGWIASAGSGVACAEEAYKSFSLGYGNLNPAAAETRNPAPGVLTALYGFSVAKDFMPYVGTGLAYSIQQEIKPGDTTQRIKAGVAGQAGIKFLLDANSSLNFDYKYLHLETGTPHGDPKTPPQSIGIGIDIKF